MNANKTLIAVSTITVAWAAMAASFPAMADDYRGSRRGERPVMVERHAPPSAGVRRADFPSHAQSQRVFTERREFRNRPPVAKLKACDRPAVSQVEFLAVPQPYGNTRVACPQHEPADDSTFEPAAGHLLPGIDIHHQYLTLGTACAPAPSISSSPDPAHRAHLPAR